MRVVGVIAGVLLIAACLYGMSSRSGAKGTDTAPAARRDAPPPETKSQVNATVEAARVALEAGVAIPNLPENPYAWKAGEVFRFEYFKSITCKQPDEDGKPAERTTEISAFLIIEIKSISAAGAVATLRMEPSRIILPEVRRFSSQFDEPQLQEGKCESIARSTQSALKIARWNVLLGANGLIYVESRTPANVREWLKDVENSANWRKKSLDEMLPKLVEQDMGLKTPSHDRDIFLYTGSTPQGGGSAADGLRPRREILSATVGEEDKLDITFTRKAPADKKPYMIPDLLREDKISATLKDVTTTEGKAVFDTRIGMPDTIHEDFRVHVAYDYNSRIKLDQEVRVQYRLRRLAPPIVKP